MQKKYLVGVDLGTSNTKAAIYDVDGNLITESIVEVPIYYPKPGIVEQENEDFYDTAAFTVKSCINNSGIKPNQITAIAFDSQMAGIGTVDENYLPVTRFDSWLDMRCEPFIEYMNNTKGELITQLTGCPPTCAHGPKILWWMENHPDTYNRIAKFITPTGYVGGRLVGLKGDQAFIDHTFLHFTGFSDNQNGVWSNELCSYFGLDPEKLPKIVKPWDVIGESNDKSSNDFGLAPGTIVAAGCGDTAANALGGGIVRPGMLFDVAGTASVFAACTNQYVTDVNNQALLTMRSVIPGLWHPLAYIAGGGLALRWFRDQFYNQHQGIQLENYPELYDEMLSIADDVAPGSEGLFFSPHLGGRVCPASPNMRGSWIGFSWGHKQAHFIRSILESIAYEYAYYLSILHTLIPNLDLLEARVIGGGSHSSVWNRIKANVLGIPYQPLHGNEFGTWGTAMIAGKSAEIYDDLSLVAYEKSSPNGPPIRPDQQTHSIYQEIIQEHIHWQKVISDTFYDNNINKGD